VEAVGRGEGEGGSEGVLTMDGWPFRISLYPFGAFQEANDMFGEKDLLDVSIHYRIKGMLILRLSG